MLGRFVFHLLYMSEPKGSIENNNNSEAGPPKRVGTGLTAVPTRLLITLYCRDNILLILLVIWEA